jgi:cellulose synthase/poly-beta-1,6-N-acetylglucosamine synthase-like glycosyltransferase
LLLVLMFLAATGFYLYVRGTVSLQMGKQTPYGAFVFAVELMGLAAVLPYAAMLVVYTAPTGSMGLPADDGRVILPPEKRFHVRVLIPCYKESMGVIKNTVNAALGAHLPPGVTRTVYLCDDGNDKEKKALMAKLHAQGGR